MAVSGESDSLHGDRLIKESGSCWAPSRHGSLSATFVSKASQLLKGDVVCMHWEGRNINDSHHVSLREQRPRDEDA